ncbi:MAG: hypothetical protein H0X31_04915 [Nostocaceae cyanobacterium]|nr:hypothetical protein [Nostocaceae cyanobacterium]
MLVATNLDQITEQALNAVRNHPQHDLNLGYRQAIWAALGSQNESGHLRRTTLAILASQYVLPMWDNVNEDNTPASVLTMAEQVLNGTLDIQLARSYKDKVWTKLENNASVPEHQCLEYQKLVNIELSALASLNSALYDEEFDPNNLNYDLTDADVDADESDSSFWAASAYADGPIWEPSSSATKRLELWEWWLTTAVSEAQKC